MTKKEKKEKKAKKESTVGTTHVLIVTDMSGSMMHLAKDVRGGFNGYIEDLKADKNADKFQVSVTVFDTAYESLCSDAKLADVPVMDSSNYMPRGMTALLDAVGRTITGMGPVDKDDRVLLVIQTDGQENSSKEFTYESVSKLIAQCEKTGQWKMIYLGSDAAAWDQATRMGMQANSVVGTQATSKGTQSAYRGVTHASVAYAAASPGAVSDLDLAAKARFEVDKDDAPEDKEGK